MKWVFRFLFGFVMVGGLGGLLVVLTRYLHPEWWRQRWIRRVVLSLPGVTLVVAAFWLLAVGLRVPWLIKVSAFLTAVSIVFMLALILGLPLSGLFLRGRALWTRWRRRAAQIREVAVVNPERRQLIQGAAAVFPALAVTTGTVGIARSFQGTRVQRETLRFAALPAALDGFRILHVTDVHLGIYKDNADLAEALDRARPLKPDLVLMTGDIADDLRLLPDALRMTHALGAPYGVYASLGNHEYSRGISKVLRIHAESPVTLLQDRGVTLDVKGHPLFLAGADDPRYGKFDKMDFLTKSVGRALRGRPEAAFTIVLSHRPEGFVPAAAGGAQLTLSGHTHGGQLGFAGRSLWQSFAPRQYLWGRYRRGDHQLFLSAGMGHWFPFRLGCPTEAPVLELRRA